MESKSLVMPETGGVNQEGYRMEVVWSEGFRRQGKDTYISGRVWNVSFYVLNLSIQHTPSYTIFM